jgi:hypothetical protein
MVTNGVSPVLESALQLASYGWRVHPVSGIEMVGDSVEGLCTCGKGAMCRHPGKHPLFKSWADQASSDPEVIKLWDWGGKNVGVVPGESMSIIDFDGADGLATLERLGEELPPLPDGTPVCKTGSGGLHIYLKGSSKSRVRLLPGLDIRGQGGQAVVPPSMHYTGNPYEWIEPPTGPLPEAPQAWLALAQGDIPDSLKPEEEITVEKLEGLSRRRGKHQGTLKAILAGEPFAEEGARDDTLSKVCGYMAYAWPFADPRSIARLFDKSIDAMATQNEPMTRNDVIDKFTRFSNIEKEKRDARPRVLCTVRIVEMANQALEILLSRETNFYSRSRQLVQVITDNSLPGQHSRPESPPAIEAIPKTVLRGMLTEHMEWYRVKADGDEKVALPPEPVVEYIKDSFQWENIHPLENITQGPLLRPDGTVFKGGGYDDRTGVLSLGPPDDSPPLSPDECIGGLHNAVVDFPFESDTDRAAWMAGVLTAVGRDAIAGPTPLFLLDANVRGAGKTLLAHTAAMIAGGAGASPATLGRDEDEDRKVITSLARAGARVILIDNVTGTFGTSKLCEALTLHNGVWADRILGSNKNWQGPFAPTWWATSNNVVLASDMARRTCYIRLSSDLERPELREDFQHPSLLAWVAEHRKYLFHCCLSLLREYCEAGRPAPEGLQAWGGYEAWSSLVRHALIWAGEADPAANRDQLLYSDTDHDYGEALVQGLFEVVQEKGPLQSQEIIDLLYAPGKTIAEMQKYTLLREAIEGENVSRNGPNAKSLGRMLTRYRGRVFSGKKVRRLGKRKWTVVDMDKLKV